jgi:hypothetical protein
MGVRIVEYVQEGFFSPEPLKVVVEPKTKMTDVKGWRVGNTDIAK